MKKQTLTLILTLFMLTSCFDSKKDEETKAQASKSLSANKMETNEQGLSKTHAVIKTVHGEIEFAFYPKDAPNTVNRIKELIHEGFYDGLKFHRVVPGFVIQGGDPTGTGMHGSGKKLKAEFNSRKHVLGTVAMARSQDVDSADSQFYIALETIPHLDGKYTVFGQVVRGHDILKKIQKDDKMLSISLK